MNKFKFQNRIIAISDRYHSVIQQVSAAVTASYLCLVIGFLAMSPVVNYYKWRVFLTESWMASFTTLFLLSICWQSWCGVSAIINDYFQPSYRRTSLLSFVAGIHIFYLAWGIAIIWNIYI